MKIKNTVSAILIAILSIFSTTHVVQAQMLPDLVITQFAIDRLEWRQMPDCNHNACQNLVWKAVIEFNFTVLNQGPLAAQIPNANFESSAIVDKLSRKKDNAFVHQVVNWESVPNPLPAGAAAQLIGRMYVEDSPLINLQESYVMCLTITDRPSDNQNWFLVESNTKNNSSCFNFILDLPKHELPNPKAMNLNAAGIVFRNVDGTVHIPLSYTAQNTTKQVYVSNIPRRVLFFGNGLNLELCTGNIAPGLHGLEMHNQQCEIQLPVGTRPGFYTLQVSVDQNNRIREANERDNLLQMQIEIR
ncbi:MAG: hypothetical protein A3B90_01750 [Candidatus Magasanikbacteria bacterium RIFCSPHIGHO2_02_FULL_41_13]|uniref:CARDB domain-containing protein n=1 Tax=Candidatus Magasanikbacteria bacterium RIFCSPHIGHO2_02_FULL_41_13 TaxID=1798676 RepID=A0A1F6M3Y6_9BACT|nr:MAG: hypothetical protein A3B90_01750 [Candidatus Magasanikbacteria bacterium RIFCSPHIGHO2_02_FULL_41_13]